MSRGKGPSDTSMCRLEWIRSWGSVTWRKFRVIPGLVVMRARRPMKTRRGYSLAGATSTETFNE